MGEGEKYQLTHSLGVDCLEIVLSILFQVLVHNIMYTVCVCAMWGRCVWQYEGGVCEHVCMCTACGRWMSVSMCVCV